MTIDHEALTILREKDGYTKTAFAHEVGISLQYLCDIEKGRRNCKPNVIQTMARVLNVPISMLEKRRAS